MARYELIDCCPVPTKLAPTMREILAASGASLQSCYRANDVEAMLQRCGKHSQTWLYEHQGTPEQPNPANPPGRSTHELRNDGVAYPGPAGIRLLYWCVGIDLDDAHVQAFVAAARRHGYIATVTYPGSAREYHHVNFRREPVFHLPALREGKRGARVRYLRKMLVGAGYLPGPDRGWTFGPRVLAAVKKFQAAHHLQADGVVGPATDRTLRAAYRRAKRKGK